MRCNRGSRESSRTAPNRRAHPPRSVAGCNRGTEFFTHEGGTGIKVRVSCDEIRQTYTDNRAKNRELREYLENGLALECRRAGCLPGWIR